jgi:hypothetical protein
MDEDRPEESRDEAGDPPARFQRFEKVLVTDRSGKCHPGTILWRDLVRYSQYGSPGPRGTPGSWSEWEYSVYLPELDRCSTLEESRLLSTGEFDPEEAHLGHRFEISFDTGLSDDESIVEGSYRVPGHLWQVFIFRKEAVTELSHRFEVWESGITGIHFEVPGEAVLNRDYMLRAFSTAFEADDWVEVRGPDSLLMK